MKGKHSGKFIIFGCLLLIFLLAGCSSKTSNVKKDNNGSFSEQKKQEKSAIIPEEKIPSLAEVYKDYFTIGDGVTFNDVLKKETLLKSNLKVLPSGMK